MIISFASRRLEKQLSDEGEMLRAYGSRARRLMMRLDLLRAAPSLAHVPHTPPVRRHALSGDWAGHYAVDITANWRLIFRPLLPSVNVVAGGTNEAAAIEIVAVTEYH